MECAGDGAKEAATRRVESMALCAGQSGQEEAGAFWQRVNLLLVINFTQHGNEVRWTAPHLFTLHRHTYPFFQ